MEPSSNNQHSLNFVDAHVHIYECFDLKVFFTKAFENIRKAALPITTSNTNKGILCLAETKGSNWFDFLRKKATSNITDNGSLSAFEFTTTLEPHSIKVCHPDHIDMFIIASQQIITAERLEVLALGVRERLPDGLPVAEVIQELQSAGNLAVLPWGVGKWFGRRGKLIKKIVISQFNTNSTIFLGDIAGRPRLWPPSPSIFALASSYGYRTLSGTDPLPLATEANRIGAYGSLFRGEISSEQPAESLKQLLRTSAITPQGYGQSENIYRFLRNQISLRLQ
jgi:hypothetical protein